MSGNVMESLHTELVSNWTNILTFLGGWVGGIEEKKANIESYILVLWVVKIHNRFCVQLNLFYVARSTFVT